jgi:hypothetical protein
MPTVLTFASEMLSIRPWHDDVIDNLGFDPRSAYVETFWLGILGPSTTWLMRRLVAGLELEPDGFNLPLAETARSLGLGDRNGRHSPFLRAVGRTVMFEVAYASGPNELTVRRRLPPLNRRQLGRLSPVLQQAHQRWQDAALRQPADEAQKHRSRQLALSLAVLGEDFEAIERQLLRWRYNPLLARESASWACQQHRSALAG